MFPDLQTPKGALVLKAQGSFFVGGENVFSDGLIGFEFRAQAT
jgi:hypothetical protein